MSQLRVRQPAEGTAGGFCHGHRPLISTSRVQLRKVRIATTQASTATLSNVGETATVRMMSAATNSSRPSRIARPSSLRNLRYVSGTRRNSRTSAVPVASTPPSAITATPAPSITLPTVSMLAKKSTPGGYRRRLVWVRPIASGSAGRRVTIALNVAGGSSTAPRVPKPGRSLSHPKCKASCRFPVRRWCSGGRAARCRSTVTAQPERNRQAQARIRPDNGPPRPTHPTSARPRTPRTTGGAVPRR